MIYDRVVQWVAGPFAVVVGGLATKMVANWNFLGQIGLGRSTTAHYVTDCVVFIVSSGVTYLAHHKWLDNLSKWWFKETGQQIPGFDPAQIEARVTALERAHEPTAEAVLVKGDDEPNSEVWEQRRKDIADAVPAKDTT